MPSRRLATVLLTLSLALGLPLAAGAQDAQALFAAVQDSDLDAVRTALDAGADVNATNAYGSTALFFAASRGDHAIVELLLERGADPNVTDTFYGATPLMWASQDHPEIATLLLRNGAEGGGQLLMQALQAGDADSALAIVEVARLPRDVRDRAAQMATDAEMSAVAAALATADVYDPPPAEPFVFDPSTLPRYEGMYRGQDDTIVEVEVRGEQLVATLDGNETVFSASAPDRFEGPDGEVMAFGGRGGVVEFAQILIGEQRLGLGPVDPEEAELIRGNRAVAADVGSAAAADVETRPGWPAFRGHDGSGVGDGKNIPASWNAETGDNVLWKTPVEGIANASPIVWDDRVFVTSAVSGSGDDTVRTGLYGDVAPVDDLSEHRFFLTCIERTHGEVLWSRDVHVGAPAVKRHTKSSQANSTPVTDGNVVVVLFGSVGVLAAYDFDGNEVWKKDLGILDSGWFYDPDYQWGHAASPVIYDDLVIVQADIQQGSFIAAYDLADGSERWRTARDEIPSWSTPVVYRGAPRDEVVTNAKTIRGYDPRTGEELWSLGPNSEIVVGSPVVGDGIVYITAGYPPIRPIYAVRPGGAGDLTLEQVGDTSEDVLWSKDRGGTYIPTPLLYRGILYTNANNGRLTAYDAATGEMLYRARIAGVGSSYVASPVAADGRIYFSTEDGTVHVVKAGAEYELLSSNEFGEVIWATPAIADGMLIVRTLQHVWAIGE